jgi:hypothetical protein
MAEVSSIFGVVSKRVPWNKGKIVGAKPPLGPKHVHSDKAPSRRLDPGLCLFNLAIDSKLRGCDVVSLKVDDIAIGNNGRPHDGDRFGAMQQAAGLRI